MEATKIIVGTEVRVRQGGSVRTGIIVRPLYNGRVAVKFTDAAADVTGVPVDRRGGILSDFVRPSAIKAAR